jgi:chemotaxis signal transduction protein
MTSGGALLIVRVGAERFALDPSSVDEVVDSADLDDLPQLGPGALGVLRLRGVAHTVWSPAAALRVPLERHDVAVFLRSGDAVAAVAFDDVEDLIATSGDDIRRLPGVDDGDGLVIGALHVGETLATVVDGARLADAVRSGGTAS